MASNQDIKKPQRKVDEDLPERLCERGKRPFQKYKPYVVLQYLLKYTDEDNAANAFDIIGYLEEHGIKSDRRSIYQDIKEINSVYWMLENDVEIKDAIKMIEEDTEDEEKLIVYDPKKKGFYARQLKYELADIILLAECVYATKFISGRDEERLIGVLGDLVSEHQAEKIFHDTYTVGRVKTFNKATVSNAHTLYYAMSSDKDKGKVPQKVSFSYLTHDVGNIEKPVERKTKYRISSPAFFGSEAYSKEELVAEIGASALVSHVGLETSNSLRNNVAYIQNWLRVLKDDKRLIVSASGKAEKAVNLILGSVG